MAESVDCSEFCRLCLVKEQVNTPIFEEQGEIQPIYMKISSCLPIKVSAEDPLPKRICDGCNYKLELQYQFWNTSINAEKQLKQWLGLPDEIAPRQEISLKIKKEKDPAETVNKRPRRNAKRKASQNVRQAAAVAATESGNSDLDLDNPFAKVCAVQEEAETDNDLNDNTESLEDASFMDVGLDSEPGQAGPSGLQKSGGITTGSDPAAGNGQLYCDTNYNTASRLFNPLMHISHSHTGSHCNSNTYNYSPGREESNTAEMASCDTIAISPVCYTDETSANSSTSDSKKNTERKMSAKDKKQLADMEKRNCLTSDGKYECLECKQQFDTNFKLQYHKKSAHEERKFKCDICFKAFLTSHHLKMHSAIHVEVKPFSCDQCSASFRYKKLLDRHKSVYHVATTELCVVETNLPFACSQCELQFATRNAYNHHTKSHKADSPKTKLLCNICNKDFITRESLETHKLTHIDEKNDKKLLCDICNKAFSHKKYLQVHQRIHSGLKPYVCVTCGKSFTQASTLTVHRRYHSGERPYTCNVCEKGFVTRTIMLTHMKKHP